MSLCCKFTTTVGFFIIAFFLSWVINQAVHAFFPPVVASYIISAGSATQIVLILYATGFIDAIHRRK